MYHPRPFATFAVLGALAGTLVGAVPGAARAATPAEAEASYAACMDLARRAPDDALTRAEGLMKAGFQAAARHCLATALLTLGRTAQAAKLLFEMARDLTDVAPSERSEAYGQAGRAWLEAGDAARAESAFSAALAVSPNDALRLIDRAIARGALKRDFEALDDLNRALEIDPRSPDARILRAAANRRVGALELAEEDIKAALELDPNSPAAWLERGLLAQSRRRVKDARAAFARAAAIDPDGPSGLTAKAALKRLDGGSPAR